MLPSGFTTTIASIDTMDGQIDEAYAPMSVCLQLEDDLDLGRGDMIVRTNNQPENSQDVEMMICWMDEKALVPNGKYGLKHTSRDARCIIKEVNYKVDINTLHRLEDDKTIGMNDIGRIKIRSTAPLFFDKYTRNRITGSIILIDEATNKTVGAGMII